MIKVYNFGFWILLLGTVTFFNFWRISKSNGEKDLAKCIEINEKRITSLKTSNIMGSREIHSFSGKHIVTNKTKDDLLKESTLTILLSDFKCNKCQEKELGRLVALKEKMDVNGINVIGITTQAKKNTVAIQRKNLNLDIPIYWVDDELFKKEISFANEYPQIIYVKDNIILSGFIPIPMDDEFSEMFYSELIKNIEESFQGSYNKF